jgi:hypothetical protein
MDFHRTTIQRDPLGSIAAQFGIGVDVVGDLYADPQGNLSYEQHPVSYTGVHPLVPLSPADQESMAANIDRHLLAAEPGTSPLWLDVLGDAVPPWAQVLGLGALDMGRATIRSDDQGVIWVQFGIGVDSLGTLRADSQGNVSYEQHPVSLRGTFRLLPLSPADLGTLAAKVEQRLAAPDPAIAGLWQQLLSDTRAAQAQVSRFDGVDFRRATIRSDGQGGLTVQVGIGVDLVGNLRDDGQGNVSYEQHPVFFKGPHPLVALSMKDRESLAANIERYLLSTDVDTAYLWGTILLDSLKC